MKRLQKVAVALLLAMVMVVSKEMPLLTFKQDGKGDVGMLSFFPSHGTSNGIDGVLVSADHKGYASYYVEQQKGNGYVAAFAQEDTGDVSPNEPDKKDIKAAFKRPADVDKSLDAIENQIIDGRQEADAALWLTKNAAKGTYRLVYYGVKKDTLISYHKVVGRSGAFTIT